MLTRSQRVVKRVINSIPRVSEYINLASRSVYGPRRGRSCADQKFVEMLGFFSASSFPLAAPPTIAQGFGWPKYGLGVEGVNSRVGRWLLDKLGQTVQAMERDDDPSDEEFEEKPPKKPVMAEEEMYVVNVNAEPRIRGWAFTDYYARPEASLVALMIECNYRGRKEGEEGW